eukprot:270047-Chlamydomonas_euryale.AAC.4
MSVGVADGVEWCGGLVRDQPHQHSTQRLFLAASKENLTRRTTTACRRPPTKHSLRVEWIHFVHEYCGETLIPCHSQDPLELAPHHPALQAQSRSELHGQHSTCPHL